MVFDTQHGRHLLFWHANMAAVTSYEEKKFCCVMLVFRNKASILLCYCYE